MPRIHCRKELARAREFCIKENISYNFFIRSTVYLVCCGVMFYQVSESCQEYYKYQTVVQIKIQKPDNQDLPAISICRQVTVTEYLDILREFDPEFKAKFGNEPAKTSSNDPAKNVSEEDDEEQQWGALNKMSKYFDLDRDSKKLFGIISKKLVLECNDVRTGTKQSCDQKSNPINSFTQKRICITYFSKLYSNYNLSENSFNISENGTSEKEEDKESLFAWFKIDNPTNDIFVTIHTSKSMPDINLYELEMTRSRLFNNATYGIVYDKYWVRRMEAPYITKCTNYVEKRTQEMDPLSEFGCMNQCKKKYWVEELGCTPIDLNYIMESSDSFMRICNCTVKPCDKTMNRCQKCDKADSQEYKTFAKDCEDNCLQDCYEEYYHKDMFELKDDFRNKIWQKYEIKAEEVNSNKTLVFIAAKYHEELSYTHAPKTSLFDFVAMLGGLFSLWIGASVLTIYDVLHNIFGFGLRIHRTVQSSKDKKLDRHFKAVLVREDLYPRTKRSNYGNMNPGYGNTGMPLRRHAPAPPKYY